MTSTKATALLFERYLALIVAQTADPLEGEPRLSLSNLAWMCREGIAQSKALPLDKLSRWLGFVQGCLAMRGLIDVDAERQHSRPLFHAAYRLEGQQVPNSLEKP